MINKKQFLGLNKQLQKLLDEQLDINLLINPLINWSEKDTVYKNYLDLTYVGREFNISYNWKNKVNEELNKKQNGDLNWNEDILNDNEIKRKIFVKLSERKDELKNIIQKIIYEIEDCMGINNVYSQAELIFK